MNGGKTHRYSHKKHGAKCVSRDDIVKIMNGLTCEKKGQRSEHYHGVYAIYPDNSKFCIKEKIGKKYGVKKIFEEFLVMITLTLDRQLIGCII